MKISVLGWYDHGNVGDEAFKLAFPLLMSGHDMTFSDTSASKDADVVVLGGGNVFQKSFTRPLWERFDQKKIAVSVGLTNESDISSMGIFDHVYLRDHASIKLANTQGGFDPKIVSFLPDATFLLRPDAERGKRLITEMFRSEKQERYEKLVVVSMSGYCAHSRHHSLARDANTATWVSQGIARVADETMASFLFLPFSTKPPHDDRPYAAWTASRCKWHRKNLVVYDKLDVQDTLDIMAAADAAVTMRYHAMIFATIGGVPFVDITHHSKNQGFLDMIGWEHSMPFWNFDANLLHNTIRDFIRSPEDHQPWLIDTADAYREMLQDASIL